MEGSSVMIMARSILGGRGNATSAEELEEGPTYGSQRASPSMQAEEKIFIAVGKEYRESKSTVMWAMQNIPKEKKFVLLHVHCPAQMIPMLGGKFPASQLTEQQVDAYRQHEKEKINKVLDEYLLICTVAKVQAETLVIDMVDIPKGLLTLIAQHGITKLIMGAAADKHYSKKMKSPKSKTASILQREAPPSCSIWFVCKGNLICNRTAYIDSGISCSPSESPCHESLQFESLRKSLSQVTHHIAAMDTLRHRSISDKYDVRSHRREGAGIFRQEELTRAVPSTFLTEGANIDIWEGISRGSRSSGNSSLSASDEAHSIVSTTAHRNEDSDSGSVVLPPLQEERNVQFLSSHDEEVPDITIQDDIRRRLQQAFTEAEKSKYEAFEESCKRQKAERDCLEAVCKAQMAEKMYSKEFKQRKDMEEILAREKLEFEKHKHELDEVKEELREAHKHKSELETKVIHAEQVLRDLKDKLSTAEVLINSLQDERDELQQERDDAIREKEILQDNNGIDAGVHREHSFSAFSPVELEQATSGFDDVLKIGEGGYGIVYKGFLRHTPVAIKKLRSQGMQGQTEFYQEVQVLSRVRHPNLVTLMGACVEDWCLIYEFLPNGSLEDRLLCKNNSLPLSWQARIRIASEVCSALMYLHTNKPHSVVHGDLKPANILLDANLISKLGDFGISRLLIQSRTTTLYHQTVPKGTFAYMDPEFCATGELTPAADIYSFGIIVLQLLTGRPALCIAREVQDALDRGTLHMILDKSAGDWPFVQAKQLAHLGLRCCEVNRKGRPNLVTDVWRVLEPMKKATPACRSTSSLSSLEDDSYSPPYFICPIFQEIMRDPHVAADGFTYEAEAIRGWLECGNKTSPMTNLNLTSCELIPNHALRSAIQEWLQQQQHC